MKQDNFLANRVYEVESDTKEETEVKKNTLTILINTLDNKSISCYY